MGFETAGERAYQIRERHRNEEVREVIPGDFAGTMITDRGRSYDAQALAGVRQQKCLDPVDRSLAAVPEPHQELAQRLRALLWEARALWKAYHAGTAADFTAERERLQRAVTKHLQERAGAVYPANQRLPNELGRHHDAGNLLRFLWEPKVEPTNNRAERALRPAVIARKVSHCAGERDRHAAAAGGDGDGRGAVRGDADREGGGSPFLTPPGPANQLRIGHLDPGAPPHSRPTGRGPAPGTRRSGLPERDCRRRRTARTWVSGVPPAVSSHRGNRPRNDVIALVNDATEGVTGRAGRGQRLRSCP
ncbi:MAG: transposase [Armatimonadetes bacterium]|nr:transposase [Armatimonadota bacterium]